MYLGQIVERAPRQMFFANPLHPYSVALMSAVPTVKGGRNRAAGRIKLSGDPPSPINPPPGCRFSGRCPAVEPACKEALPPLREITPGHWVRCRRIDIVDRCDPGEKTTLANFLAEFGDRRQRFTISHRVRAGQREGRHWDAGAAVRAAL